MRQRTARFISNLLNPFLVSFVTIIFLVMASTTSFAGALKWTALALALSVLSVFFFVLYQVRRKKLDSIFPESPEQRRMIYLLGTVMAAAGCGVMWRFQAPGLLAVSFTAGLAAMIIFMAVNMYWKISLHTAFISAAATVLTLAYGAEGGWVFLLLPPVAWARLELRLHTPLQVIAGALLAAGIVAGTFWGFEVV